MSYVVIILSLSIAALGVFGLVAPQRLVALAIHRQTRSALLAAGAFRLVLGVALILAAPASKAADVLRFLGVVLIVAGLATPLLGVERSRRLIEWWAALGSGFVRAWGCIALAIGLLLIYAVAPW